MKSEKPATHREWPLPFPEIGGHSVAITHDIDATKQVDKGL